MIFVTVGTHEQPFDRLIKAVDVLKKDGLIHEKVFMQTGYSTYTPTACNYSKFCSYDKMKEEVQKARIVITHGGPASFLMPLQIGKIPIVVPRQSKFNEHVNNHQLDFAREVANRMHNIIVVDEISELYSAIDNYSELSANMSTHIMNNNQYFNDSLEKIVDQLTS